ncbi:hypothetical protein EhV18_00444 [Emiliania huxleyi virus 18]|nr:hypothetical protein EhV18_00444 [Emiliania huxleyi virus 18]
MNKLNTKNDKGTLDPNITECASLKFIDPLKKSVIAGMLKPPKQGVYPLYQVGPVQSQIDLCHL